MESEYLKKRRQQLLGNLPEAPKQRKPLKKPKLPKGDINTLSQNDLEKVAQNAVNRYVRERDKDKGCICGCGGRVEQAGHLFPAGSYSGVRFDDRNVHGIARACNYFKSTPAIDPEVEVGVLSRIGIAAMLDLTRKASKTRLYKWTREDLISIIDSCKKKITQ